MDAHIAARMSAKAKPCPKGIARLAMANKTKLAGFAFIALVLTAHAVSAVRSETNRNQYNGYSHDRYGCNTQETWDCRSQEVRQEFLDLTGFPNGRPGWIVDHIEALACGGPDAVSNMQWQDKEDSDAKDRWERIGCSRGHRYSGRVVVRGQTEYSP
jgi:hypothetical protein